MNALVRFVSSTRRHSTRARSCGGFLMFIPALFTSTSSRPNCSADARISAFTEPSSATSTSLATACAPSPMSSFTARALLSRLRPATTIAAPAAAIPRAMPSPMPPLPPVTTATRPFRSNPLTLAPFPTLTMGMYVPRSLTGKSESCESDDASTAARRSARRGTAPLRPGSSACREELAPRHPVLTEEVPEHHEGRDEIGGQNRPPGDRLEETLGQDGDGRDEEHLEAAEQHEEPEEQERLAVGQCQEAGGRPSEEHEGQPVHDGVLEHERHRDHERARIAQSVEQRGAQKGR